MPKGTWFVPYGAYIPIVNRYRFKERPPYGIKDERLRAKMEDLLFSGAIADAGLPFMPGRSLAQNLSLIRYVKRLLPNITAPLLIVHSTEDDITHIRNAEDLALQGAGGRCASSTSPTAIIWSPWTASAPRWPRPRRPSSRS